MIAITHSRKGEQVFGPNLQRIALLRDRVDEWDRFPFTVPAIASFESLAVRSRVVFFTGENGSGKSTLLEALADYAGFGREGGTRNVRISTRDDAGEPRRLSDALRLTWKKKPAGGFFLRAESFFNVATYLESIDVKYGRVPLHELSHGEAFLALFVNRFDGPGFYLLDEPEAALSPQRQLSLLVRMHDMLSGASDVQFVIATHSPILLAFPGAQILSFDGAHVREIAYEQTEPYTIVRSFLGNPERYLARLFAPEPDGD